MITTQKMVAFGDLLALRTLPMKLQCSQEKIAWIPIKERIKQVQQIT
jgi:hypothetical protein